jgi:osmotically-inducible protein OsmY
MAEHHEGKGGHHHYHPHPGTRYYYGYYGPYHQQAVGAADDLDIKSDVESALKWDSYVDASRINLDVKNGIVTLRGNVEGPLEKRSAGDDAWDTPGVVDVVNELELT